MTKPAKFWNSEHLQQAAISELLRHGGNKRDLDLLRQQFRKADENNSGTEIPSDQKKGRQISRRRP